MGKGPVDPKIAALLSSVFAILGVFGVFEMLELTADQTAILVGALGAFATTVRAWLLHKKAKGDSPTVGPTAGAALVLLFGLGLTGCAGYGGPTSLQSVVGRIDVGKVIACARQPTPKDKARCLGVQALNIGIDTALDEAAHWGLRALKAISGAGADDLSDKDRNEIAAKADAALAKLGAELAAANEED